MMKMYEGDVTDAVLEKLNTERKMSLGIDGRQSRFSIPNGDRSLVGMKRPLQLLRMYFGRALKHQKYYEEEGLKRSAGIILYGPPGTGKTHLSEAIAREMQIPTSEVKISDIVQKYVGESAKQVAELFADARASSPCLIFFDEAETLLQERDQISKGDGGSATELYQAVSQTLIEISKIQSDARMCVFMLAATNKPWMIDMAHRRSGRFDLEVYVGAPNFWDRRKLLDSLIGRTARRGKVNLWFLALATWGYSPADIVKIVKVAKINSMEKGVFTTKDFQRALRSREAGKSSLDVWYSTIYHEFLPHEDWILEWIGSFARYALKQKPQPERQPKPKEFTPSQLEAYREMVEDVKKFHHRRVLMWCGRAFGKWMIT